MAQLDPQTETAVRRFLALIASRYDVDEAVLFGSRARGTHQPESDADLAVVLNDDLPVLGTTLVMADVAYDVLLDTGINISPLPIWKEQWEHPERSPNPRLIQNILHDGIRL